MPGGESALLEVQSLLSLDVHDRPTWRPDSPEDVRAHHEGEALRAYTSMCGRGKTFEIDAMLVIDPYDWPSLHDTLLQRVASCERSTWVESLDRLRTKFFWEYEGTGYVAY
jgi:hypothetical protein